MGSAKARGKSLAGTSLAVLTDERPRMYWFVRSASAVPAWLTPRTRALFVSQLCSATSKMRGFLLCTLLYFFGCQPPQYTLPPELLPSEAKLIDEIRADKIKFLRPDNWEIEEQPTSDANITILGGLSPDNKSLLLFVSLKNVDPQILRESDLIQIAQEKFFNNSSALSSSPNSQINNLTGTKAEFSGVIGNNVVGSFGNSSQKVFLFTGHYQGTAFIFIVATQEKTADQKILDLLQQMMGSIKGD